MADLLVAAVAKEAGLRAEEIVVRGATGELSTSLSMPGKVGVH